MRTIQGKEVLTPEEAATLLEISRKTIMRWLLKADSEPAKQIRWFKHPFNRRVYIEKSSIDEILERFVLLHH